MGNVHKVMIAGAGGIGRAVALLLRELGDLEVEVYLADGNEVAAQEAAEWVRGESTNPHPVVPCHLPFDGSPGTFHRHLDEGHILLDCLPGSLAPQMARLARDHRLHYANLTEYVEETREVTRLAEGAETGFLLQTGLAPGFINVLANGLFRRFCDRFGVDRVDTISMRVGALPQNAIAPHYYGFTWSPIGVATEYLKPAVVVRDGHTTTRRSLTDLRELRIKGLIFEEALTSGGAADLPEALAGRVRNMDYKTLRYPGHWRWVKATLENFSPDEEENREKRLQETMEREVPTVHDDLVVIYADVEGRDAQGRRQRLETSRIVEPCIVGGRKLKAIQATTAAGLAESARLLLSGEHQGVVLQSQIDAEDFMYGPYVRPIYFYQEIRHAHSPTTGRHGSSHSRRAAGEGADHS
jgi:saccharopine dehydrogenase-like NADP-dependent oxidoreductase